MSFDPAKVEIRDFRRSDFAAIISLVELLKEAPQWPPEVYDSFLRPESSGERIALVAQEQRSGEVLGFSVARLIAPEAELESIAVAEASQRRGVGRQLLSALVLDLRRVGIETLHLEVRVTNQPAISLYKSFGFSEIGRRARYYTGPVEDALVMSLKLD